MASKMITQTSPNKTVSRLIKAVGMSVADASKMPENAQFGFKAVLITPTVKITNDVLDMEFEVPFDDDMVANEAEFTVFNLSDKTINALKYGDTITLTAGYGDDTGIIFSGFISKVSTQTEGTDRATTINALDDIKYSAQMMNEQTFSEGVTASTILNSLLSRTGLPIEVFKPQRDHTYWSETKIDGSIVENIKTYSDVCGVSTYVHKQKIYCRPIWDGDNLHFNISTDTGMINSPEPFEEENQNEEYVDKVTGFNIEMLLQHRIATAGIVHSDTLKYKGDYRIVSGTHSYDGLSATTKFKCIQNITTSIDQSAIEQPEPKETEETESGSGSSKSGGSAIDKAVSWALQIANDDSHGYSQSSRWGADYDCSSFLITAWQNAGVNVKSAGASTTANMYKPFISCGFTDVTSSIDLSSGSGLQKGDVILRPKTSSKGGHTVMYIGSGNVVHASTADGHTKTGDQTGKEICTRSYYSSSWKYVLRYKG